MSNQIVRSTVFAMDIVIRRMTWIAAAFVVLILAVLAFRLLHGATVYLSNPGGFVAHTFGEGSDKLRPVGRDRYERILERFIQGDLFDSLWIAHRRRGDDGGLVISFDGDEIEMDVSFLSLKESDRWAAFRQSMKSWGYIPESEHLWNVGLGDEMERVTMEYRVEKDLGLVRQAVKRALDTLEGPAGSEVYVHAWRSQDGPSGIGIKIVPHKDILADVL